MIPMAILLKSLQFDSLGEEAERKSISVSVFSALLCYLVMMDHCLMTSMTACPHVRKIAPHDKDPSRADG